MAKMEQALKIYGTSTNTKRNALVRAAHLLGDTWALLIVNTLLDGDKRFGELLSSIERINPQTLSLRLKMLEAHAFVEREAYAEIPPRVLYRLTAKGQAMATILQALTEFGEQYLVDEEPASSLAQISP